MNWQAWEYNCRRLKGVSDFVWKFYTCDSVYDKVTFFVESKKRCNTTGCIESSIKQQLLDSSGGSRWFSKSLQSKKSPRWFWKSENHYLINVFCRWADEGWTWIRKISWVAGTDSKGGINSVYGKMTRMANLDWWKASGNTLTKDKQHPVLLLPADSGLTLC